jgi:hypothetical protein
MSAMHEALAQYVALRRALGAQLQEPSRTLIKFLDFLEREGAEFITSEIALRWAMEPKLVQRATWARRLGMVRRFASWPSTLERRCRHGDCSVAAAGATSRTSSQNRRSHD